MEPHEQDYLNRKQQRAETDLGVNYLQAHPDFVGPVAPAGQGDTAGPPDKPKVVAEGVGDVLTKPVNAINEAIFGGADKAIDAAVGWWPANEPHVGSIQSLGQATKIGLRLASLIGVARRPSAIQDVAGAQPSGATLTAPNEPPAVAPTARYEKLATPILQDEMATAGEQAPAIQAELTKRGATIAPAVTQAATVAKSYEEHATRLATMQAEALKHVQAGERTMGELGLEGITVSEEETINAAQALGLKYETVASGDIPQPQAAVEAAAVSRVFAAEAKSLHTAAIDILKRAANGEDTSDDLYELIDRYGTFAVQGARVAGMRSAAGRTLQILDPLKPENLRTAMTMKIAQQLQAGNNPVQLLHSLSSLTDEGILKAARQQAEAVEGGGNLWGGIMEYYRANLLSNPMTNVRNLIGNATTSITAIPERALASRMPGATVRGGEYQAMVRGLIDGFGDAARLGWKSLKTGRPEYDAFSGVQFIDRAPAITSTGTRFEGTALGKGIDYLGSVVRLPFRPLTAGDQFFAAINDSMEGHALAYRQALAEVESKGMSGPAAAQEVERVYGDYVTNPTPSMIAAKRSFRNVLTFHDELSKYGKAFQTIAEIPGVNVVVPFAKTPYLIDKYGLDYVPGVNIAKNWSVLRGGPSEARDLAGAKLAMSAIVSAASAQMVADGYLTGDGPSNPASREQYLKQHPANSFYVPKLGWLPTDMLGPFHLPLNFIANIAEMGHELQPETYVQAAMVPVFAFGHTMASASYVTGLSRLMDLMTGREGVPSGVALEKFLGREASGFIPEASLVGAINRADDPTIREADGFLDELRARVPGYSQELGPRRDMFANAVSGRAGVIPNLLFPIDRTKRDLDDVEKEIARVEPSIGHPRPWRWGSADKLFSHSEDPNIGVHLTPKQFDQWQVYAGEGLHDTLEGLFNSPRYLIASDDRKRKLVSYEVSKARDLADTLLLANDPDVARQWAERQSVKALSGIAPEILNPPEGTTLPVEMPENY